MLEYPDPDENGSRGSKRLESNSSIQNTQFNSICKPSDTASSTHMLEVTLGFSPSSHHHAVTAMVWAPAITPDSSDASSSRVLFTAARDSTIRSWYAESNETLRPRSVMHGHSGWITDLIYIASHHRLASCSLDRRVKIWHPDDGRCFNTCFGHDDYINALTFCSHTDTLFSAGNDSALLQWSLESEQPIRNFTSMLNVHCGSFHSLTSDVSGALLATGGTDSIVRVWDSRVNNSAARVNDLPQAHSDVVRALAMRDDSQQLVSAGSDGALVVWDLRMRKAVDLFNPLIDAEARVQTSADALPPLRHRARSEDDFESPTSNAGSIMSLAISGDGSRVVCGYQLSPARAAQQTDRSAPPPQRPRGVVTCTDLKSRQSAIAAVADSAAINVCFSQDERTCIYSSADARLSSCNVASVGTLLAAAAPPQSTVLNMGRAPLCRAAPLHDGRSVLVLDVVGAARVWDVLTAPPSIKESFTAEQVMSEVDQSSSNVTFEARLKAFESLTARLQLRLLKAHAKYAPQWFSTDLRLGALLVQIDPVQCFAAEAFANSLLTNEELKSADFGGPVADEADLNSRARTRISYADVFLKRIMPDFLEYRRATLQWKTERSTDAGGSPNPTISEPNPFDRNSALGIPMILHQAPPSRPTGTGLTSTASFIVSAGGGGGGAQVGSVNVNSRWRCYALGQRQFSVYERVMPSWITDALYNLSSIASAPSERQVKFDLLPVDASLPELPKGSRLTCPGCTKLQSFTTYVSERLPELNSDEIEFILDRGNVASTGAIVYPDADKPLPLHVDINTVRQFYWLGLSPSGAVKTAPAQSTMLIRYRKKAVEREPNSANGDDFEV